MSSTVIIAAKLYYFNDSVYLDLLKYMETSIFKKRGGGGGGGGRGGLTGSQFLEGRDFFQEGGCSFYIKNKLKSEIFKVYEQKCFYLS